MAEATPQLESEWPWRSFAFVGLVLTICTLLCADSLVLLVHDWFARGEYSHGMLIPLLTGMLLFRHRAELAGPPRGIWAGGVVCIGALTFILLGRFSTIHAITQYGFVTLLIGCFYLLFGIAHWRRTLLPLLLLFFMVPLPHFLHQAMSAQLQLWSSELGVALIQLCGISVYLEGNVIDLGSYQLQVLEACDGLRYLFPLMTLGFIMAYLYQAPLWERAFLFLLTIPLTVGMNGLRIGVIGVMVEYAGPGMAEGMLHDVQGWLMFLVCVLVLIAVAKRLASWRRDERSASELFGVDDLLAPAPGLRLNTLGGPTPIGTYSIVLVTCIAAASLVNFAGNAAQAELPQRRDFLDFPLELGEWQGRRDLMDPIYLDELQLSDYLQANFQRSSGEWSNLYIAYYDDQVSGRSVHSPRTCLPGGGWEMESITTRHLEDPDGRLVPVNRVIIGKGMQKQLVYYWFEQRGRLLASELAVKYYLLRDSMLDRRSDGALVRLIAPLPVGADATAESGTERALTELFREVRQQLPAYVRG